MIYLDNAATTPICKCAVDKINDILLNEFGNPSSVYSYGKSALKQLNEARKQVADAVGADSDEIMFTSCGSESDNWALRKMATDGIHNRIIVSAIEHHAVLNTAKELEKQGCKLDILEVDSDGRIKINQLESLLSNEPCIVSVMMVNNEIGTIEDIKKISELVHSKNPENIMHTDAVQAVGHVEVNVDDLGVDLLSASGHKFNGPKGIGFLYVRKTVGIKPMITGGDQEKGHRAGTENVAYACGMAAALAKSVKTIDEHLIAYKDYKTILIDSLNSSGVKYKLNSGDFSIPSIVSLSFPGIDGEGFLNILDMKGICVSTGSACNSRSKEPSHVLRAVGLPEECIDSTIRISFGEYNTREEIINAAKIIGDCAKRLMSIE